VQDRAKFDASGFYDVQLHVEDYDLTEVDFEMLPCSSNNSSAGGVEQVIRCELLDFIGTPPTLSLVAQMATNHDERPHHQRDQGPHVKDHVCKVSLPIWITTFLKPLPLPQEQLQTEGHIFEEMWERRTIESTSSVVRHRMASPFSISRETSPHGLQHSPGKLDSPEASHGASPGSTLDTPVSPSTRSSAATPWNVIASSSVALAVVSCRGAFQYFQLVGGSLGLGAELPPHGCVPDTHKVLVKVSLVPDELDPGRGAHDFHPVWEVSSVAQDKHLAQSALAAVATQLKCLPNVH